MARKEEMFIRGKEAAIRVFRGRADGYVCPICLEIHESYELLTEEHVPPKSIGGRVICLTCKECNSNAGHAYEYMLVNEKQGKSVLGPNPVQGEMNIHGLPLRGEVSFDKGRVTFVGNPKQNNPSVIEELLRSADETEYDGTEIKITGSMKFDQKKLNIAYLKIAYLAAFAKFGYSYIGNKCISIVRDQIRNPNENLIPRYRFYRKEDNNGECKILIVNSPVDCLICIVGCSLIFLPVPGGKDVPVYEWLQHNEFNGVTQKFGLNAVSEWPNNLEMYLDYK